VKWGIRVGEVPRALWVQVALSLATTVVFTVVNLFQDRPLILVALPVSILFEWLLLRRSRVIWTLLVATAVLSLATAPFDGSPWWNLLIEAVSFALLLFPSVRRFVWSGRRRKISPVTPTEWSETGEGSVDPGPETSWNPRRYSDADRPKGWYVHPESPGQMQYWGGEDAGWLGTTKVPRKIRAELDKLQNRN
jgi:hypothetical protein